MLCAVCWRIPYIFYYSIEPHSFCLYIVIVLIFLNQKQTQIAFVVVVHIFFVVKFKFFSQLCAKRFFLLFFSYTKTFHPFLGIANALKTKKIIRFRLEHIKSFSCYWTAICWYSSWCTYEPFGWWRWCRRSGTHKKNTQKKPD